MNIIEQVYFKFNGDSEASIKRLLYNELLFLDREELNDPYDVNIEKKFVGSKEQYNRIFMLIYNEIKRERNIEIQFETEPFILFCEKEPFSNLVLDEFFNESLMEVILLCFSKNERQAQYTTAFFFAAKLYDFLKLYLKDNVYIVSFSKTYKNPLMWSHYANEHKGFCLVFSSINKSIYQDHRFKIQMINSGKNISYSIPEKFKLHKVKYSKAVSTVNGFISLPQQILGQRLTPDENKKYWKDYDCAFTTKSTDWKYEQEYRLLLNCPVQSKYDRLLYFDITQLTGLIVGNRMEKREINDIKNIVYIMRKRLLESDRNILLPVFTFFKAELVHLNYSINIKPIACLDMFNDWQDINKIENLKGTYYNMMRTRNKSNDKPFANYKNNIAYL